MRGAGWAGPRAGRPPERAAGSGRKGARATARPRPTPPGTRRVEKGANHPGPGGTRRGGGPGEAGGVVEREAAHLEAVAAERLAEIERQVDAADMHQRPRFWIEALSHQLDKGCAIAGRGRDSTETQTFGGRGGGVADG